MLNYQRVPHLKYVFLAQVFWENLKNHTIKNLDLL